MKDTIQVRTGEIHPHTHVLAIDSDGVIRFMEYGELGSPFRYLLESDLQGILEEPKPRTDTDRMQLLKDGYTYAWYRTAGVQGKFIAVFSPLGQQLTGSSNRFKTLEEALDYVLDQNQ